MTSGSSWNYYRDEINDDEYDNCDKDNMINKNQTTKSKSFKCNTIIIGSMQID